MNAFGLSNARCAERVALLHRALVWLVVTLAAQGEQAAGGETPAWQAMNYGPFLTASIEAPQPRTNIACKGIAVNLGANFGGAHNEAVIFDTDLLRYSAGWTGDFVALKGVVFDGEHWAYPRLAGQQVFGNPVAPGWAHGGSFTDPREFPYGPLPRDWAHWKGLFLHEQKVVLSYSVGKMSVLEMPALERNGSVTAFVRTLNMSAASVDNVLQLAFDATRHAELRGLKGFKPVNGNLPATQSLVVLAPSTEMTSSVERVALDEGLVGRWEFDEANAKLATDASPAHRGLILNRVRHTSNGQSGGGLEFKGKQFAEIASPEGFASLDKDFTVSTWVNTRSDGSIFTLTPPGDKWASDCRTLYVRGGKLAFEIGGAGTVMSSAVLNDGDWHHVTITWSHSNGAVTLFLDGQRDGVGNLKPHGTLDSPIMRLGFTATNFPGSSWLRGRLDGLRLYGRALNRSEVLALAGKTPNRDTLAVALVGAGDDARWLVNDDGHVRLRIPAHPQANHCKVLIWSGPAQELQRFADLVKVSPPPADLEPFTHGGPPRWSEKLLTHGQLGTNSGPYAIDTLTEPATNPWHSWLRFGGMDFFPDGKRAALCTWNGDVWIVSGVDGDLADLTWQRIATGLYQPLGLQIVDGEVYVLGRDQITRLRDLNGDGETDFYENFNNDCMNSEHFHEFALDLKFAADGNFYYVKNACHGLPAFHPHHGTLMRVSRDGSKLEVVARGLRSANGLGVGPHGEFTSIDNQGFWMPGNRINWMKPGGWYGNQWAWNPENRNNYDEPLCWMHNFVDRSGGSQFWVPSEKWGPFRDDVITISYGMGHMFLVLKEEIGGLMQGAVTRFPFEFDTGAMRGAWHPQNGQLYTSGLYGWAGNKTKAGGFYRVRYTGKPAHMANALHFVRDGIVLGFTDPLDVKSATDPGNFNVKAWNYKWTINYGSPDFKLNGQEGRDTWPVESATLSADRRTVFLKIPSAQRVMQLHLVFNLTFADGAKVGNFVHGTIHQLDAKSGLDWLGAGALARVEDSQLKIANESPGLAQTFISLKIPSVEDTRESRLAALYVPAGSPPTPFLDPGAFRCRWEGFLKLDLNDNITFETEGAGQAKLRINGELVLDAPAGQLPGARSQPVAMRSGLNRFELEFESPPRGEAEFRLAWSSKRLPKEPVPATAFVHDAAELMLSKRLLARQGRTLFTERHCTKCHQPESAWATNAMPELSGDAPEFNGIGSRLQAPWIAKWLLEPKVIRHDALMPRMLGGANANSDAEDIAAYLSGLGSAPVATSGLQSRESASGTNLVTIGAKLFGDLGCAGCHSLPGELTLTNDLRVTLNHVAAKWKPAALETFLRAPATHYRWIRMPDFKLATNEAAALAAFVLDRVKTDPVWQGVARGDTTATKADAKHGAQLVATLGCLSCHSLDKVENQFRAPTLANLRTGNWTRGCMAGKAEKRGKSPDFGFDSAQIAALRAFSRDGFPEALHRDAAAEFAARQYAALRCNACHARDTETDLLTRLAAAAPKPKILDEEEGLGGGGSVHVGRPLLTYVGEKLYAGWMQKFFDGTLPYKPRPELQGRMPAFASYAAGLADGLAQQHGYPSESAPPMKVDSQLAAIGQKLTLVSGGFSCVSCHNVGAQKALAGKDTATVNFACVAERLRPSYYWRYVQDPPRLVPSTMMPKFIGDDGSSPIKTVFGGDPQKQFDSIWHYLMSLRTAELPK